MTENGQSRGTVPPVVLAIGRLAVLIGLLAVCGTLQLELGHQQLTRPSTEISLLPWTLLVLCAVAFLVVARTGRQTTDPVGLLAIEAIPAAAVGLVYPLMWFAWLGSALPTRLLGGTTGMAFVQALALAWLVTVVFAAMDRRRQQALGSRRGTLADQAS